MTPPTVLHLLDYVDLGGGETSFLAFIEEWLRAMAPVRPVVILPGEGPVGQALERLGVETHRIPFPRRLRRGPLPWFSLAAARRIDRLVGELNPLLIHAHHFFGMLYAGPAARRRGIPLVWTCHGWFDIDTVTKRSAARLLAAHVTCVSEAVRSEAARFLTRPGLTSTDYLGIRPFADTAAPADLSPANLREAVRSEMQVDPATPLLAVIGRFQPIKGHQHLLSALPAIRRRLPGLQVWFVGDALFGSREEQEHKAAIERRVRQEGLADCVRFLGFRSDARRLLRGLDALVIPSERESFSMVAVEGLEAGIPVIGPDGWGPREIIQAPQTGLRFRPADPASLAEKTIQALLREGEGAAFEPQAGPRRVQALFTVGAHVGRAAALYRALAGPAVPEPAPARP